MNDCYYTSFMGQIFGWTQILPSFVTSVLSIMSFITSEIIFVFYGLYLHIVQLLIWTFQTYFQKIAIDPICQQYQAYAFPSVVVFYSVSLVTFVISYAYYWYIVHSWFIWLMLDIILIAPAFVLVFVGYNQPWEVFFSAAIGVVFTWIYVLVLKLYISPTLPFILNEFPCSLMGYGDNYLMNKKQQKECIECKEALDSIILL